MGLSLSVLPPPKPLDPQKTIPQGTNQVIGRILIFYIGSLAVLLSLYPWNKVVEGASPFVMIFHDLDSNVIANILNIVVLTAALSVYNSCVYCNSRMLFGLAQQGNGTKALLKVDRRGVPYVAPGVSAAATALCVLINYLMPDTAFRFLMTLVVAALVINWAIISYSHLKFRRIKAQQGVETRFKALWYPASNWICLAFMAFILILMSISPDMRQSVIMIPLWLIVLGIGYFVAKPSS